LVKQIKVTKELCLSKESLWTHQQDKQRIAHLTMVSTFATLEYDTVSVWSKEW